MVNIWLRGPVGLAALVIIAVCGFLLAMGDVLDLYDALWKFTVPATVVYGALLWRFALTPAKDDERLQGAGAWTLHLVLKLGMTVALMLGTLGVIALGYDVYGLVLANWRIIVVAIGLLGVIAIWATLAEWGRTRKRAAGQPAARSDDLVS
jgi:hypothetical protein